MDLIAKWKTRNKTTNKRDMKAPPTKKRSFLERLISVLLNPWFWDKLWRWFLHRFFPTHYRSIEVFKAPPEANLVKLDGTTTCKLEDFIVEYHSLHMPLILNVGSYNWSLFMAKMDKMAELYTKYCSGPRPLAKLLTIYIEECK